MLHIIQRVGGRHRRLRNWRTLQTDILVNVSLKPFLMKFHLHLIQKRPLTRFPSFCCLSEGDAVS